jgi:hypothetical protein
MAQVTYPSSPGLYKVFLADAEALADTPLSYLQTGALLYLGRAKRSLRGRDVRQHLASGKTGRSTLRRSLGAVLRSKLGLQAGPRDDGSICNYCFIPEGEECLTTWMHHHLQVSWSECSSGAEAEEKEPALIASLSPALNIDHRPDCEEKALVKQLLSLAYKSYNAQAHSCQVPGGFFRSWQCHYILRASIRAACRAEARVWLEHLLREQKPK